MVAGQLGDGARDGDPAPSSFLLLLNFIFTACEKFHKSQFHFPFPTLPGICPPRDGRTTLPGSSGNIYVPITFSFYLQKSSARDTMEDRINCLCVGIYYEKSLFGE